MCYIKLQIPKLFLRLGEARRMCVYMLFIEPYYVHGLNVVTPLN